MFWFHVFAFFLISEFFTRLSYTFLFQFFRVFWVVRALCLCFLVYVSHFRVLHVARIAR